MTDKRHYHIIAGHANGMPYHDSKIDEYEESIVKLTSLSTGLFGHLFEGDEKLTLERFLTATENGDGGPIMIGTSNLCLCWWPCESCQPLVSN